MHETDVVVIGAGAAGVAAARRLAAAQVPTVVLEARNRVGGRAWTMRGAGPCRESRISGKRVPKTLVGRE